MTETHEHAGKLKESGKATFSVVLEPAHDNDAAPEPATFEADSDAPDRDAPDCEPHRIRMARPHKDQRLLRPSMCSARFSPFGPGDLGAF